MTRQETWNLQTNIPTTVINSFVDETELNTEAYLGRQIRSYSEALSRAKNVLRNQGYFTDMDQGFSAELDRLRALIGYVLDFTKSQILDTTENTLGELVALEGANRKKYLAMHTELANLKAQINSPSFRHMIEADPRNLLVVAASVRQNKCLDGFPENICQDPEKYQKLCCSILKVFHTYRLLTENGTTRSFIKLGNYLKRNGSSLENIHESLPRTPIPQQEDFETKLAYIQTRMFMGKLVGEVIRQDSQGYYIDTREDYRIRIKRIESRLKDPASMVLKLGRKKKETVEQVVNDTVGIGIVLENEDDTLPFIDCLQEHGIATQERTDTDSIHQTIYKNLPNIRSLIERVLQRGRISMNANEIGKLAQKIFRRHQKPRSKHSAESGDYPTYQFKITHPIRTLTDQSGKIVMPVWTDGRPAGAYLTVPEGYSILPSNLTVEFQISDEKGRQQYRHAGRISHGAYKFKSSLGFLSRAFKGMFTHTVDPENNPADYRLLEEDLDLVFKHKEPPRQIV